MKKLNITYFGTPSFSALFLEKLITDVSINRLIDTKLVVTQPDRPVGRKQILTPTPVKQMANKYKIQVQVIDNFKTFNVKRLTLKDLDLAIVFAFGEIIPKELLNLPRLGFINIHPSLLPQYRGPSPIAYPLINGDTVTGVTLIKMDEQIDHGPIIAQEKMEILPTDRRPDLEIKLTDLAFKMFKRFIAGVEEKGIPTARSRGVFSKRALAGMNPRQAPFIEQNHKLATYTKLLKKSDGFIPFENLKLKIENSPKILFNYFRGLYPWPGLWTHLPNGKRLKITNLTMNHDNKLTIESVQLGGKKEIDFKTFNRAYKVFTP